MTTFRIGTRGSPLALWQARWVRDAIAASCPDASLEIVEVRTLAEKFPERAVADIGAGIFTRELDDALLGGAIDLAVHSLKDVPTDLPRGIALAAVPERASPLDAFISADGTPFAGLEPGSTIGTGSPRRQAQILWKRPDLRVLAVRGNVATRIQKMRDLGLQGLVLAHAGLLRLGKEDLITHLLPPETMVPAVGQGLLAVTARDGDRGLLATLRGLEHGPSRLQAEGERAFLRRLRGGCLVPAGALAEDDGDGGLRIQGVLASTDGSSCVRGEVRGDAEHAESLGRRLAEEILQRGGAAVIEAVAGAGRLAGSPGAGADDERDPEGSASRRTS